MSIRIHKVLGYGLKDIIVKNGIINDPRFKNINEDESLCEKIENGSNILFEKLNSGDLESFQEEFTSIISQVSMRPDIFDIASLYGMVKYSLIKKDEYPIKPSDKNVHYDFESSNNVIVFTPPENPDYHRYDDSIDYYDSVSREKEESANRYKELDRGIYPYCGYENIIGKEKIEIADAISFKNADYISDSDYSIIMKYNPDNKLKDILKNNYRFKVPSSILLITWYADVFTDWAKTITELKPAIYEYWN